MSKFTKGPWYFDAYDNLKSDHAKTATNAIPLYGVCLNGSAEAKANTKLIAAAPELYEAADSVLQPLRTAISMLNRSERRTGAIRY